MNEGFVLQQQGNLYYYTIPSFAATGLVSHGFTTRRGGVSNRPFDDLNLAFHVGDYSEHVIINRKAVAAALEFAPEKLVVAEQVHGDRIKVVTANHTGMGALDYASAIPATDALITNVPGIPLGTFYADCVPVLILDPKSRAIGMAHAGWKGTALKIAQKTVLRMSEAFATRPVDCIIGIGPSIGPCCYEVENLVYREFDREYEDTTTFLTSGLNKKWQLNLWQANLSQLLEIGIRQEKVDISRICTCCNKKLHFSYRGDEGRTGRMGAFMMLREVG